MTFLETLNIERRLRSVHGWLGAIILPWVVVAGLTGFYMNHERLVLGWLPDASDVGPEAYADQPEATPVASGADAMGIASRYRPDAADMSLDTDSSYADRVVWTVDTGPDAVIVDRQTGFVWLRERYRITAFAPDGTRVGTDLRWSRILSSLHTRGWVGEALGKWLADITAIALVVFGLSGLVLFWAPRRRRNRNRAARLRAANAAR